MTHGKNLVRDGYERLASAYEKARAQDGDDIKLLSGLVDRMPPGGRVLDMGCGSGVPVAQTLSHSFHVVGLDFAGAQLTLAHANVPEACLVRGDLTQLPFGDASFDGACSFYAIIHIPREEHSALLRDLRRILRPSGVVLLCMGQDNLPGEVSEYMGNPMFWSHFDAATNERLVPESGFDILTAEAVRDFSEPSARHRFILARRL